ncbi:MAG: hypothetical protein DRN30_02720 [Thermoplasmata archaeon]|nr:MAG: hypothetical protein DRN30_02720 [Thermoplasmata archaeon]
MENEKASPFEIGWLAGIIDGEGCFTIRLLKRKTKYYGVRIRVEPRLSIVNTNEEMINKIISIFEKIGIKKYGKNLRKRKEAKDQIVVTIYTTGLKKLLPLIKDICIKKGEIEIIEEVIKFQEEKKRGKWGRHIHYTVEDLEYLYNLRNKLLELHGRQAKKLIKIDPREYGISEEIINLVNRKIYLQMTINRKDVSTELKEKMKEELKQIEEKLNLLSK